MSIGTIFEIESELRAIWDSVEELNGEISPDIEGRIKALEISREAKLKGCAMAVLAYRAKAALVEAEIDRLVAIKKTIQKCATGAETFLASVIPPGEKHDFSTVKIGWRKSKGVKLLVASANDIPEEFCRFSREANKEAIRSALEGGAELDFATIEERNNLSVK